MSRLGFVPAAIRQKILHFRASWQKDFPVLWELALAAADSEFAYFSPPGELGCASRFRFPAISNSSAGTERCWPRAVLGRTVRSVAVPLTADFCKAPSHGFRLLLTLRHAPEKTIEKYFAVELEYLFPDDVTFDPLNARNETQGAGIPAREQKRNHGHFPEHPF